MIDSEIGGYHIQTKIGQGGMADVYRAYQPELERSVAIKILRSDISVTDNQFIKRFEGEAKSIAKLEHPHILPIYAFGFHNNRPFIVTRYIEHGLTLHHHMVRPLQPEQALKFIVPVGKALSYAHHHKIIHRDVKPSNILLDKDQPLLADFGLARAYVNTDNWTNSTSIFGTPAYMSPEQISGANIDGRSDMYALGLILYEMITGHIPHQADTPFATMYQRNTILPTPPQNYNPNISDAFSQVLLKALATNAEERFTDMSAFVTALQTALDKPTIIFPGENDSPPLPEQANRVVGLLLIIMIGVFVILFSFQSWAGYLDIMYPSSSALTASTSTPNTPAINTISTDTVSFLVPTTTVALHTQTTSPTATSTATNTPTTLPTPTPIPPHTSLPPTQTITPTSLPFSEHAAGVITPISPDNETTTGLTTFQWEWTGPELPNNFGFEVSVWRAGEARAGVHNAITDNHEGQITSLDKNLYQLTTNISNAYGVQNRPGSYIWAVSIVKIDPAYDSLADKFLSQTAMLQFAVPEGGNPGGGNNPEQNNTGWIE